MPKHEPQLIIPFAKQSGMTSFTSLRQVKLALGTKKIGHTGTLDSFADGLLVLLSGKLTKLVPYITEFDKRYAVTFYFGEQTDTLDPEGSVVLRKPLPLYTDFQAAVKRFQGRIEQFPPAYSAIKVNGERLSDRVRRGETVAIKSRIITIHAIKITEVFFDDADKTRVRGAVMQVHCSKGTYIRSLVRDIAVSCSSAAYVYALRRTAIGPFSLQEAAGSGLLPVFHTGAAAAVGQERHCGEPITQEEITAAAYTLDEHTCTALGFQTTVLHEAYCADFLNGKKIQPQWFTPNQLTGNTPIAVLHHNTCLGLIMKQGSRFIYKTVFG